MNLSKIFSNISPFFLLSIIAILWALFNIILIYTYKRQEVVHLPGLFIMLIVGVVLLITDRWAMGMWDQKPVVLAELILIPVFYLFFVFSNRKIIVRPAENIQTFSLVYHVEKGKESGTEYAFPFNRTIKIHSNNQIIFLNKEMKEGYAFVVESECSVYISGRTDTIANKEFNIELYSLCKEISDTDEILNMVKEKMGQ